MYCIFIGYVNMGYEYTSREAAENFAKTLSPYYKEMGKPQQDIVVKITRKDLSTILSPEAAAEIIKDRFDEDVVVNKVEAVYGQYNCFTEDKTYYINYNWFYGMSGVYRGTTAYTEQLKHF